MTEIRPMQQEDIPQVAELELSLFGHSAWTVPMIVHELLAPGRAYFVAHDADTPQTVLGYAGLWFNGDDAQVMTIGVAARAQGKTIGTRLLQRLLDKARSWGAQRVLLEVRVDNERAISLYKRHGFEILGLRKKYYQPEGIDAYVFELHLPSEGSTEPQ